MVENFDKWDQQEIEDAKKKQKEAKVEQKEFKANLKDYRRHFREKIRSEKRAKIPSRDRDRFKEPLTRMERKRFPTHVAPGTLEKQSVELMAPPGCKVHHDTWNGRWTIALDGFLRSRSWLKYGHTESAVLVVSKMWKRFMELYGLEECPVGGLMERAAEIERAAAEAPPIDDAGAEEA